MGNAGMSIIANVVVMKRVVDIVAGRKRDVPHIRRLSAVVNLCFSNAGKSRCFLGELNDIDHLSFKRIYTSTGCVACQ